MRAAAQSGVPAAASFDPQARKFLERAGGLHHKSAPPKLVVELTPMAAAATFRLEHLLKPPPLALDVAALQSAIDTGRQAGVSEAKIQAAMIKMGVASSGQMAAKALSTETGVALLDVDAKALERQIEYTREMSYRVDGLGAQLEAAEGLLERARQAQEADRDLARVMSKTKGDMSMAELEHALRGAEGAGVPVARLDAARHALTVVPAAQHALGELNAAVMVPKSTAVNTSRVRELLDAAIAGGVPESDLVEYEDELAEAMVAQAESELSALLGPELMLTYPSEGINPATLRVKRSKGTLGYSPLDVSLE